MASRRFLALVADAADHVGLAGRDEHSAPCAAIWRLWHSAFLGPDPDLLGHERLAWVLLHEQKHHHAGLVKPVAVDALGMIDCAGDAGVSVLFSLFQLILQDGLTQCSSSKTQGIDSINSGGFSITASPLSSLNGFQ